MGHGQFLSFVQMFWRRGKWLSSGLFQQDLTSYNVIVLFFMKAISFLDLETSGH